MNYKRLSELYHLLDVEMKKTPVDAKRVNQINHYLSIELGSPVPPVVEPVSKPSWWDWFTLPPNWKIYVTAIIGAFIAFNSQIHLVPQNVQDALLAAAVSLGFWAVNHTQTLNYEKIKLHIAKLRGKHEDS